MRRRPIVRRPQRKAAGETKKRSKKPKPKPIPKVQESTMAKGFDEAPKPKPLKAGKNRPIEPPKSRPGGFRLDKRFPVPEIFPALPGAVVKAIDAMLPKGEARASLILHKEHGIPITNAIVAVSQRSKENHPEFHKRW